MLTRRALLELATVGAAAAAVPPSNPPFTLPKLPYAYDALEPYIDAQTTMTSITRRMSTT